VDGDYPNSSAINLDLSRSGLILQPFNFVAGENHSRTTKHRKKKLSGGEVTLDVECH